jgi:hypothetical protein
MAERCMNEPYLAVVWLGGVGAVTYSPEYLQAEWSCQKPPVGCPRSCRAGGALLRHNPNEQAAGVCWCPLSTTTHHLALLVRWVHQRRSET